MKIYQVIVRAMLLCICSIDAAYAQALFKGAAIVPSNPTSADSVTYVRWEPNRGCERFYPEHKVSMANNHITITFAKWNDTFGGIAGTPPDDGFRHIDSVDLGRLPAGEYTLSTVNAPCTRFLYGSPVSTPADLDRLPFKVTGVRPQKTVIPVKFYPSLDFTGQWSDENDPGWALFVSQDAADNLLVAWNSYAPDGTAIWYVMQPPWGADAATANSDIWQTSKPPLANSTSAGSIPTGATKIAKVGTAVLGFYFGERNFNAGSSNIEQYAIFSYTLGTAPSIRRTLTRFKAR